MESRPFSESYDFEKDDELIEKALSGSKIALEFLIKRHQNYIYNVAFKMVMDPDDAQDLTQEVLIKLVTNLSKFNKKSSFRTWAYRIVVNHFLNSKKRGLEKMITSFSHYGKALDETKDAQLTAEERIAMSDEIREAKVGCMSGMLLCLDRDQRLIYVIGEIFKADHQAGAEIFGISKDNFRQKLTRARKDIHSFMDNKCGLVNKANPCRCHKKTKAFIERGWVDRESYRFSNKRLKSILDVAFDRQSELVDLMEDEYPQLFRDHPFQKRDYVSDIKSSILDHPKVRMLLDLED